MEAATTLSCLRCVAPRIARPAISGRWGQSFRRCTSGSVVAMPSLLPLRPSPRDEKRAPQSHQYSGGMKGSRHKRWTEKIDIREHRSADGKNEFPLRFQHCTSAA